MIGLTRQQLALYNHIAAVIAANGIPPSFVEMRDALGLQSTSSVHRLIVGLEERGYVRRLEKRARAIELLKPTAPAPDSYERDMRLLRALHAPIPTALRRVRLTGIKPVPAATAHAGGHSLGGKATGMSPAAKGSHSGRRA